MESGRPAVDPTLTVLILTAAIGGGHEAAGRAVQSELERAGHRAVMLDGLRAMSPFLAFFVKWGYIFQLKYAPWSIRPLFIIKTNRYVAAFHRVYYGIMFCRRLKKTMALVEADVIVSTYPLITLVLGWMRRRGQLNVPTVTVIADYGVHRLWISPWTELHLVTSRPSLELVQTAGGRGQLVHLPLSAAFQQRFDKFEARRALGLPVDSHIVLIVGGAWGVGDIETAAACAVEAGAFPVVVAGNNRPVQARLEARFDDPTRSMILGWTQEMARLMAAADCLVQNAGGVTCHEAIAVGLPVLFFNPIPGHGEMNARLMERAGAARWIRTEAALAALLRAGVRGQAELPSPVKEPGTPVVQAITHVRPRPGRLARQRVWIPRPAAVMAASVLLMIWLAFNPVSGQVGAMVLKRPISSSDVAPGHVALIATATDAETARALEDEITTQHLPVALFVDAHGAQGLYPASGLVVGIIHGSERDFALHPWRTRHRASVAAALIQQNTGTVAAYVLSSHGGASLVDYVIGPNKVQLLVVDRTPPAQARPTIVVIGKKGMTAREEIALLHAELDRLRQEGLQCEPLTSVS